MKDCSVQNLIDALMKIEDKTLPVMIFDVCDGVCGAEVWPDEMGRQVCNLVIIT